MSEGTAEEAVRWALDDTRMQSLLGRHPHVVTDVRWDERSGMRLVEIEYDQVLADDEYPHATCTIETGGAPITGHRWLVDVDGIAAMSPRWGDDISCVGG